MSLISIPTLRQTIAMSALTCFSLAAQAHHAFLVPSSTVVSGDAPSILVDAGIATNVFEYDHMALQLDNLSITAPDGSPLLPENITHSRFRNSFELQLKQKGSYKLDVMNQILLATYKDQGESKRWRGTASAITKEIPTTATDLQVSERINHVETIVTNGKPGGKRYRQDSENQQVTTNSDGIVSIQWKNAGLYWLQVEVKDDLHATPPATSRIASYSVTLEVLPQ